MNTQQSKIATVRRCVAEERPLHVGVEWVRDLAAEIDALTPPRPEPVARVISVVEDVRGTWGQQAERATVQWLTDAPPVGTSLYPHPSVPPQRGDRGPADLAAAGADTKRLDALEGAAVDVLWRYADGYGSKSESPVYEYRLAFRGVKAAAFAAHWYPTVRAAIDAALTPTTMDQEPSMKKSRDAMAKWFMAVAYDVLDPAVFKQIADAALLRAQLPMERKSQPGDARSFNNSHWSR